MRLNSIMYLPDGVEPPGSIGDDDLERSLEIVNANQPGSPHHALPRMTDGFVNVVTSDDGLAIHTFQMTLNHQGALVTKILNELSG